MEASGHARWFERLLAELQFELWIGDAALSILARGASCSIGIPELPLFAERRLE